MLYSVMLSGACVSAMLLRLSLCYSLHAFVWYTCIVCAMMCGMCVLFVLVCVCFCV